jgi:hypothetical protein
MHCHLKKFAIIVCSTLLFLSSCTYDNEVDLYKSNACDISDVSYMNDVQAIFNNYGCTSCHNNLNTQGGVNMEGYDQTKIWIDNGRLLRSIKHLDASPMPKDQPKMDSCSINKIEAWITNGAPNN